MMQNGTKASARALLTALGFLALAAAVCAPPARAQRHYVYQQFPFNFVPSKAQGLNNYGLVTGGLNVAAGVAVPGNWDSVTGRFTLWPVTGIPGFGVSVGGLGEGINDSGVAVGTTDQGGILLFDGSVLTTIPGPDGGQRVFPAGINNSGQIAGHYTDTLLYAPSTPDLAFLWTPATPNGTIGSFRLLGALGAYSNGVPYDATPNAISNTGEVVGWTYAPIAHGFAWAPFPGMVDLGALPNPVNLQSRANAVNDDGWVAGWSFTGTKDANNHFVQHAILVSPGFTMLDIGGLAGPVTMAHGLNGALQVVGESSAIAGSSSPSHAFLWQNGTMYDLNDLFSTAYTGSKPTLRAAYAINERGQILTDGALLTPEAMDVSGQVSVTRSGLIYNRSAGTFNLTLTIANPGSAPVYGPFQVVIANLTTGVTLQGATGTHNGSPYALANMIAIQPGQSVSVPLQFKDPAFARFDFTVQTWSGGF